MHREARMFGQPRPHFGMFVRSVVVGNDVDVQVSGDALVDLLEKRKKLLVAMPWLAVG